MQTCNGKEQITANMVTKFVMRVAGVVAVCLRLTNVLFGALDKYTAPHKWGHTVHVVNIAVNLFALAALFITFGYYSRSKCPYPKSDDIWGKMGILLLNAASYAASFVLLGQYTVLIGLTRPTEFHHDVVVFVLNIASVTAESGLSVFGHWAAFTASEASSRASYASAHQPILQGRRVGL